MSNVVAAILLTAIAGLSTGVGGLFTFFSKKLNTKFLSLTLGLSAGVMIYISFVELLAKSGAGLLVTFEAKTATILNTVVFFVGMFVVALIDRFIPEAQLNRNAGDNENGLMRTGVVTALALGIHNFPEGMATFVSALESPSMALPIVCAIAIHNIPEGIAVSVPIFYATKSRKKAL